MWSRSVGVVVVFERLHRAGQPQPAWWNDRAQGFRFSIGSQANVRHVHL